MTATNDQLIERLHSLREALSAQALAARSQIQSSPTLEYREEDSYLFLKLKEKAKAPALYYEDSRSAS
jgi:hypothetical protein